MLEAQPIQNIELSELVSNVKTMFDNKYRLVQIGCTKLKEGYEINYVFDKEYAFQALRVTLPSDTVEVPSVSGVYLSAFLYENEIHDLYGITISDIAVDYKGTFYKTSVKTPFK